MKRLSAAALLLVLATPAPAPAQVASPLDLTTDPADKAVMAEAAAAVADPKPSLARLDAVLARLPRPTPLRGMIQALRAAVLNAEKDSGPAVAAIEEALRLLPDHPLPKLVACEVFTFSGAPQRAADLWIAASRQAPEMAQQSERYTMLALVGRLHDMGDRIRADRLSARLGEIGFASALAPERSNFALARLREAMRDDRQADAIAAVPTVGDVGDLVSLYVDKRYAALWPRIAEWAGDDDFDAASRRYLEELRADWEAADDFATATPYARHLAGMRAYAAVVALFLPMFDHPPADGFTLGSETLAPIVARALSALGREADGRALLARVAAHLSDESGGNALNIDASYMTLAALRTDWADTLARSDAFLARARSFGASVNGSAIVGVQARRACALSQLGRAAEAQRARAEVMFAAATNPGWVTEMLLCVNDIAAVRAFVIDRLADDSTRTWALNYVQPGSGVYDTAFARLTGPRHDAVRASPDVIAAANRVGRILPAPIGATLPKGFEPLRTPPTTRRDKDSV